MSFPVICGTSQRLFWSFRRTYVPPLHRPMIGEQAPLFPSFSSPPFSLVSAPRLLPCFLFPFRSTLAVRPIADPSCFSLYPPSLSTVPCLVSFCFSLFVRTSLMRCAINLVCTVPASRTMCALVYDFHMLLF